MSGDGTEALFRRLPDEKARAELLSQFRPLALRLAQRYAGRGQDLDDLSQVACIGLLNAIDRFDVDRGSKFVSFAIPTITGELKKHFRDTGWATVVPRRLKDARVASQKANSELTMRLGRSPSVEEIAEHTGLPTEDVLDAAALGSAYRPDALDGSPSPDAPPTIERVGGDDERFDLVVDLTTLASLLERTDERNRELLHLRFVEELTQREIARRLGISQMHVSRLLKACLDDLQHRMLA